SLMNPRTGPTKPSFISRPSDGPPAPARSPRRRGALNVEASISALSVQVRGFGERGEQDAREHVVEHPDPRERDHDGLVDGSAHPFGAALDVHALVTAGDR